MNAVSTPPLEVPEAVNVASLDQEGRGIARVDGKAVFVEGALPAGANVVYLPENHRKTSELPALLLGRIRYQFLPFAPP